MDSQKSSDLHRRWHSLMSSALTTLAQPSPSPAISHCRQSWSLRTQFLSPSSRRLSCEIGESKYWHSFRCQTYCQERHLSRSRHQSPQLRSLSVTFSRLKEPTAAARLLHCGEKLPGVGLSRSLKIHVPAGLSRSLAWRTGLL